MFLINLMASGGKEGSYNHYGYALFNTACPNEELRGPPLYKEAVLPV